MSDLRELLHDLAVAERRACFDLPGVTAPPEPQCSWLCSNVGRDRCATGIHRDRPWCRIVVAAECIEETRGVARG